MKLWAKQDGWIIGESSDKIWPWRRELQTISVFLPWEPHEQYEKAKRYHRLEFWKGMKADLLRGWGTELAVVGAAVGQGLGRICRKLVPCISAFFCLLSYVLCVHLNLLMLIIKISKVKRRYARMYTHTHTHTHTHTQTTIMPQFRAHIVYCFLLLTLSSK